MCQNLPNCTTQYLLYVHYQIDVKIECTYYLLCSSTDLDSVGRGWGLRFCISDKLPGDTKTASLNVVL